MGRLHLGIRGSAVANMKVFQQFQSFKGNLINLAPKAANSRVQGQFIITPHPIFFR
jgi:hypothetical protein